MIHELLDSPLAAGRRTVELIGPNATRDTRCSIRGPFERGEDVHGVRWACTFRARCGGNSDSTTPVMFEWELHHTSWRTTHQYYRTPERGPARSPRRLGMNDSTSQLANTQPSLPKLPING